MTLEHRAWRIARILAVLLFVVSLRAAYWQLWRGWALQPIATDPVAQAQEYARLRGDPTPLPGSVTGEESNLASLPQPVIQRTVQMLSNTRRGTIYDSAGNILVEDQGQPGSFTRVYSNASLAHVVGYTSALRTGINGLEAAYNQDLLGMNRPDTEIDRLLHRPVTGSNLVLTIHPDIQASAVAALEGMPGAVVALDTKTGAVLAMTSSPTFDPNLINNDGYIASLGQGALINRATQGLFTPGSIWKTLTMIAALDSGQINPDFVFDFGPPSTLPDGRPYYIYEVDGGVIFDANHAEQQLDLSGAYARSANAAFARLANEMPAETFIEYAARFGFSDPTFARRFPLELPLSPSLLSSNVDDIRTNNLLRASVGYGQGELLVTPLQMAMVVQAVLNDGAIPIPFFVAQITDPQGGVIRNQPHREIVRGTMRARTARQVKEIMIDMVDLAFGGGEAYLGLPGVVMGGKTGTAQLGGDQHPHRWFIGFAEYEQRSVVIVVLLENSQQRPGVVVFQRVAQTALTVE